ncbi:hypothetical protein OC846_004650 [Tilletia horrida]|uniref:Cutinase n=1 Tax=Tilletia horrida TaxID=155126 RepID=A0AAN6GQ26_9BASI|nr:hypothetical protein OC846_004650 [Tilletia horrida]KAK0560353.1 hypothetical protein OC861_006315 [Tilletia horrida]
MTLFRSGFLTLALALSASASRMAVRDGQASTDSLECKDYLIISSRGTYEKPGPSFVFTGMIKSTLDAVPNGQEVDNPYPASAAANSPDEGINWLQTFLTSRVKKCPNEKYGLMGYSQGAAVVTLAAAKLTKDPVYNNIKGIVMVGDPFRGKYRPGNYDESGGVSNAGVDGKMMGGRPPLMDTFTDDHKVLDVCYTGDFVCDNDNPSNDPGAHGKYGASKSTQDLGAKFLIEKLGGAVPASSKAPAHAAAASTSTSTGTGTGSTKAGSSGTDVTGTDPKKPESDAAATTPKSSETAGAPDTEPKTPSTSAPSQQPPIQPVKKPHHHKHKHHHKTHHHHASLDQDK